MKQLTALLLALLLLALPALAEPMSLLDYTDDILEDGSPIYYFQELSLKLPADWRGKVMAMKDEHGVGFYQIASYRKYEAEGTPGGGFLFMLSASVNTSFTELPSFRYLGFSGASAMNYYLSLPSDYPAYMEEATQAEYDAMCAQIDDVVQNAAFYAGTGAEKAESEADTQDSASAGGVSLERARYHYEHSALPRYFYDNPENMLRVMEESGAYRLWTSLADENGVKYPYQSGDYAENLYTTGDGATILQIIMPRPEAEPQCYRVYMLYNPATGDAAYYTVEYEGLLGEDALLCGWSRNLEHTVYGGAAVLDESDGGYREALLDEAKQIAKLVGYSTSLTATEGPAPEPSDDGLVQIACSEQGFTTMAKSEYAWDYQAGTGISIYTQHAGSIPYVIVFYGEDLLGEPYEYIQEQYTPHMQQKYGDALVSFEEVRSYEIGGKQLPEGLYSYYVGDTLVDMIRLMDSTGSRTVSYTAKYIHGEGDATLDALDTAIRGFRAE